jgi:CDP-diacylglycerol--glycerol-3-phosphate 3-phosphatidyltransferase
VTATGAGHVANGDHAADTAEDHPPVHTFGPSALLTPANGITAARLVVTPVFVAIILLWGASWAAFSLGGVIALSDGFDGWVARKQGATRSGAFLDPLADKVAVLAALVALVVKGVVFWVPVAIIAVREIAMSIYRSVVGRHGVSIPARTSAKVKTLVQDLAIGLCLAPPLVTYRGLHSAGIWAAAALTAFTGAQYFIDGRRAALAGGSVPSEDEPSEDRRAGARQDGEPGVSDGPGTTAA